MTSMPRWVRPAVATLTIAVIGAAAVVSGTFFAPKPAAPATASFPVLQPIGYGDEAPALDDEGSDEPVTSPVQGMRTVQIDEGGIPMSGASLENIVHELAGMDDPGDADWSIPLYDGADDPCSPAEGSGSDDSSGTASDGSASDDSECPDGLHGALFSIVSPDSLWGYFKTSPPDHRTNQYELAFCPEVDHDDVSLPFGIATTAPGTVTFSYWPRGNEAATQTITLTSTDEQVADWQEHLATEDSFAGDWTMVQHCGVLHDLTPYIFYDGKFTIHDILGRDDAERLSGPFSLPDDRTAPDFYVQPLGKNAIFMSAPHIGASRVEFNVQVLDPGETPDCNNRSDDFQTVGSRFSDTVNVSAEYLAAHHYRPEYTKRTNLAVYVPSGSTVLACVAVTRDHRPGWAWNQAQVRLSSIIQTPDTPRPTISVDSVNLNSFYTGEPFSITALWQGTNPAMRCDLYRSGVSHPCGADPHEVTRGDVWITASVDAASTRAGLSNSMLLPLGSIDCDPGCVPPSTAWYVVPIQTQEHAGGLCESGSIGRCPAMVIGTARIRVTWAPGQHGGEDTWHFSRPTREDIEHELDPLPQMDFSIGPTVPETSDPRLARVLARIVVDRPVDYTATLVGDCQLPGAQFEASGHATPSSPATAVFTGACPGEIYHTEVQLTDADGNTNRFGGSDGNWWYDSMFNIPYYHYDVLMGKTLWRGGDTGLTKMTTFWVRVDTQDLDAHLPSTRCFSGARIANTMYTGGENMWLSENVKVEIMVGLASARGDIDGPNPTCTTLRGGDRGTVRLTAEVSIDDLLAGVTISAPDDAAFPVEIALRAVPPRAP